MFTQITEFLFGFQRRLGNILRYNTRPRTSFENVAEHSYYVALYSMILADYLKLQGKNIDVEMTIRKALLHDIEESVSGDIIKTVKDDEDLRKAYDKIAISSVDTVLEKLPDVLKDKIFGEWLDYNVKKSIENIVVKVSDDLSGIIYCKEQINMGNKYFNIILNNYMVRFKSFVTNTDLEGLYDTVELMLKDDNETTLDLKYNKDGTAK